MLKTRGIFNNDVPRLPLVALTEQEKTTVEENLKSIVNLTPVIRRTSYKY